MEQGRPLVDDSPSGPTDLQMEVHRLRRTLDAIAQAAGRGPSQPVVGVLDPSGQTGQADGDRDDEVAPGVAEMALAALRMGITVMELRRRLAGYQLRQYTLSPQPLASDLGEDVAESLCPWEKDSAAALRAEVDALVVLPGPVSEASARALAQVEEAGIPVHRLPAGGEHADLLVLAGRLTDPTGLDQRRQYLAVSGLVPASGEYLLSLGGDVHGAGDVVADGADSGSSGSRPAVPVVRPAQPLSPIDLLALIHSAQMVVTSSAGVAAVAHGLGRPVSSGDDAHPGRNGTDRDPDRTFDELHRAIIDSTGGRLAGTVSQRLQSLERRVATLETANAGLRRALSRERSVMAAEVGRRQERPTEDEAPWSPFHAERMARELDAAQMEIARLHAEIQNINSSRAMRVVRAAAPARRVYARARRLIRR